MDILKTVGASITKEALGKIIAILGEDSDGKINQDEFQVSRGYDLITLTWSVIHNLSLCSFCGTLLRN